MCSLPNVVLIFILSDVAFHGGVQGGVPFLFLGGPPTCPGHASPTSWSS